MSMDQEQQEPGRPAEPQAISPARDLHPTVPRPPVARPLWQRLLNSLGVLLFVGAVFAFCLWLYTRNNTFPVEFHPDEPSKVDQVTSGYRNFNHPALMLEATELWMRYRPAPRDMLEVAAYGREVSAFFGASAAALLALTAYLSAGWWGLILGGLALSLCPSLLTYSHYMKEDASLVFGMAVAILASRLIWSAQRWWTRLPGWILLAAGIALCASGKYAGAVAVVLPLMLLFMGPRLRWYKPLLRLLLVLLVVLPLAGYFTGWINHRGLNADLDASLLQQVAKRPDQWQRLFNASFLSGFEREKQHANTHHWGLTANQPNSFIVRTAFENCWAPIAVTACAFPLVVLLTRRRGWGWELVLVLFGACFALVLSYSVILFDRYALPIVLILHLMAAIAAGRLLQAMQGRRLATVTLGTVSALGVIAGLLPTCMDYTWQFTHDSRFELQAWALKALPPNARVFADDYAGLGARYGPASLLRTHRPDISIRNAFLVPLMGDLPSLTRASDETYLVVCDLAYSRYYEPSAFPAPGHEQSAPRHKAFYDTLLTGHKPIWGFVPKRNMRAFTNPAIHVYRITRPR